MRDTWGIRPHGSREPAEIVVGRGPAGSDLPLRVADLGIRSRPGEVDEQFRHRRTTVGPSRRK